MEPGSERQRDVNTLTNPLVVIVDDEPSIVEVVCTTLEESGISALGCTKAPEAFWFIGRYHPKLVILDVQMPGVDGIQLFEQLRADPFLAQTAVIFLTANSHIITRELPNYAERGAALIEKPFDLTMLLHVVHEALATSREFPDR